MQDKQQQFVYVDGEILRLNYFLLKGAFTFFDVEHMLNPPISNVPA